MRIAKLTQLGNCMAVVIPAAYRRELGWIVGDYVTLGISHANLVLKPVNNHAIKTRKTTSARGAGDLSKVATAVRSVRG